MRIVIANAPCYLDNGQGVIAFPSRWDSGVAGKPMFQFYPYELAYLSSLLKRELPDAHVTMLDGNLEGWGFSEYVKEIEKHFVDGDSNVLICELSALTYPTMTRVMQESIGGTGHAILCGPMAGHESRRAYDDGWTMCFKGEYEVSVMEFLTGAPAPSEARTEAGLINLDWLPWPEDEDVDRSRYYEVNHYAPPAMIQLYATRGCPLSCTFCVVPTYYGGHGKTSRSHRTRNVEDVADEITYLAWKYDNFHGCYFNEEAHSNDAAWLASFCETLIARGLNKYQYDAMCGMWAFDEELVKLCAAAGYKQIRFGVESTSEAVGQAIKKSLHLEKMERFMGWCKKYGIKTYGTVQIGAMGSTEATDRQTIADVKRWYSQGLMQKHQVSTSTPQPGTPFHAQAKREGWLVTEDINLYDGIRAVVNYPDYSAERIQAVRMAA